ncbi:MAG: hydroxymethylglutaryl-CoA lyase [Flavobacteriaceae bacterium]|jgi:hydroxymethylglutaryl-CoA lyase|nr:hydroxymethylglutaryl-CoA lyase [Flavobacteriaceae bacterium]MDC1253259.1 hydroxymethylglutaryl-CoA lyase [bacterium]MBT4312741.1 hydroxymethylglutaryl-CoA lyase [Flavobacteriaceae bacterium]MBT5091689.1 hydroxymethylglutaryl-CoA lyase [Flavobacteriaceae bacterium]MBT5283771.1 hydroxymethylglutaryl-CoA lyase [Flavobacteriaceae bacterium]
MLSPSIKLIECPRDAIQGISNFICTEEKVEYYQSLLKVGFDTLDCGSFVSPKVIPQMADTSKVISALDLSKTKTKLLTIIANERGALEAVKHDNISYLGYPFSVSENFQMRNTRKTISESIQLLKRICEIAKTHNKQVVVYLSMGFGNPYGDPWSTEIIENWTEQIIALGVNIISISDTVGTAQLDAISNLYSTLIPRYPHVEFGAHFHTNPILWYEKVNEAYLAGCKRFDGTIKGWGGCPMAQDALVGNMPMEKLISYFTSYKILPKQLDVLAFESAYNFSHRIFLANE